MPSSVIDRIRTGAVELARHPALLIDLPRWVRDRGKSTVELRRPWWAYRAIQAVSDLLPPQPQVFEYGGGGSTLWLSDIGARIIVVEHDKGWYRELRKLLPPDVDLRLVEVSAHGVLKGNQTEGFFDEYVAAIDAVPESSLDLAIVDGRARVASGLASRNRVKPGGLLLLDDSNRPRYQPLVDALSDWKRRTYYGLKPGGGGAVETSIWQRPA